jgi:phosphatidate cytidylyltransferase
VVTKNHFVFIVLIIAFGTDIFAYFTGMLIGKHKLAPNISPKKTIEGSIGGIIGTILLCSIFFFFTQYFEFTKMAIFSSIMDGLIYGLFGSVVAQTGDLSFSAIKRKAGIKDYGNLIPGHGGVLDRIDSVLFVSPFVFIIIMLYKTMFI